MADSDKNLNIGINFQTTKSGGDPEQEIKKVKVEAADLSKTTKELEGNVTKTTTAQKQFTIATQGLGQAMRFLPGPIKEVVMALRLLFTNPVVAFFVLGASAVKLFADQLKKLGEDAKTVELLKGMSASVNEAREAVQKAIAPLRDYQEAMAAAAFASSDVDEQTKNTIEDIRENAQIKEREAEAAEKLAAARLKARHAAGGISDAQFAKETAAAAERSEWRKGPGQAATTQAIIAAKEQGLAAAQARSGPLADQVTTTAERRAMQEAALKTAQDDVAALREKDKTGNLTKEESALLSQRSAAAASAEYDLPAARFAESQARRAAEANTRAVVTLASGLPRERTSATRQQTSDAATFSTNQDAALLQQISAKLDERNAENAELKKLFLQSVSDGVLTKAEMARLKALLNRQPPNP